MTVFLLLVILSTIVSGVIVDVNVSPDIKYAVYEGFEGGNVQKYFADVENLGSIKCSANLRADFPSSSMTGADYTIKPGETARLLAYTRLGNGTHTFNITVSFCNSTVSRGPYFLNATNMTAGEKIELVDYISDSGRLRLRLKSPEESIVVFHGSGGKARSLDSKLKSGAGTISLSYTRGGNIPIYIISMSGSAEFSGEVGTGESPIYKKIIFSIREILGI